MTEFGNEIVLYQIGSQVSPLHVFLHRLSLVGLLNRMLPVLGFLKERKNININVSITSILQTTVGSDCLSFSLCLFISSVCLNSVCLSFYLSACFPVFPDVQLFTFHTFFCLHFTRLQTKVVCPSTFHRSLCTSRLSVCLSVSLSAFQTSNCLHFTHIRVYISHVCR